MKRFVQAWNRFWYEPSSPLNLGICRILFFGLLIWFFWSRDFSAFGDLGSVFWMPVRFMRMLAIPQPTTNSLQIAQAVWKCALVFSCLGLFTRCSTFASFVFGVYLLGTTTASYGKIAHSYQLVVFILAVMAMSRCGDACSLDRKLRNVRKRDSSTSLLPSGDYTWPVRLVWTLMALIFFASGVAKLRVSGVAWITSDNLSNVLVAAHYGLQKTGNQLGLLVAQSPWLCALLATGTILLETGAPLALVGKWLRGIIISSLALMQLGIGLLLSANFILFAGGYLFWVPWDRLFVRIRRRIFQ